MVNHTHIKQADVASQANVSRASVSAVMNHSRPVSPRMRQRVLQAMHDLGYEPDAIARSLKLRRTHTIGMLAANIFSPFYPAVARGAEDCALEHHYTMFFNSTDEKTSLQAQGIRLLLGRRVDGLILAPAAGTEPSMLQGLEASGIPTVLVDRTLAGTEFGSVTVDNETAAYRAVAHLIESGRRRIACLAIPTTVTTGRDRVAGFLRACADAGLSPAPELIRSVSLTVADGLSQASELLSMKPRPDAIFATNHSATLAALEALDALGVAVPDEVALVGFDDMPWLALMRPSVTAIWQPMYEIGYRAVEQTIRLIEDPESGPVQTVLLTSLVERESCGCQRRAGTSPRPPEMVEIGPQP